MSWLLPSKSCAIHILILPLPSPPRSHFHPMCSRTTASHSTETPVQRKLHEVTNLLSTRGGTNAGPHCLAIGPSVLFLRKQLAFYEVRQAQPRRLNDSARVCLILWSRLCDWKEALVIVKPETLIGWHRKGFKLFWKWKSQAGRPRIPDIRKLIVQMAQENP